MKEKNNNSFLEKIKHKYRLIIMNDSTLEERLSFRLSRLNVIAVFTSFGILLFVFFLLLVGYTPLNEYVPGKASSGLYRELIAITLKTDSLEKKLLINELYLKNISAIVNGEDPISITSESSIPLSVSETEISFKKSKEDSLLRITVEAEDKISISNTEKTSGNELESILFFSPIKGVVTSKFDRKKNHFGTDIVAKKDEPIKCVYDGVVVISHWTSETGYVIGIQHENNYFSLYKHNSVLLKEEGDRVNSGEVIAIIGNSGEFSSGPHLHFELWHKGTPINPENYILF
ncbi:MAG: M23 family metallopeptidase [Flavobacteriales bacterium]|nr:M23 family metallopeptidase [Flavobacteriales bacterium]